jgi:hypothetical protein
MARTPLFTLYLGSALLLIPAGVDPKVNVTASLAHAVALELKRKSNCEEAAVEVYYLQLI